MTDNKRTTNKQIFEKLENLKMTDTELNALAIKIVSRMVKLKSMEDWFHHVSQSDIAWSVAYQDLELDEEVEALGEAAKLMTIMEICKQDEHYEKCIFVGEPQKLINKYKLNTNDDG